jgi:hypothetical protein
MGMSLKALQQYEKGMEDPADITGSQADDHLFD